MDAESQCSISLKRCHSGYRDTRGGSGVGKAEGNFSGSGIFSAPADISLELYRNLLADIFLETLLKCFTHQGRTHLYACTVVISLFLLHISVIRFLSCIRAWSRKKVKSSS